MKKILLTLAILTILSAGCGKQNQSAGTLPSPASQYNYTHQLKIGGQSLMVEIATTPAQMQQGLSDRLTMADNQGMLFDFSAGGGSQLKADQPLAGAKISGGGDAADPTFWMKDMKFNLDFIWIAGGKVVGITPDVIHPNSPNDPLPYYYPPQPINQVVEVNAGWAEKNNIKTGDDVRF